MVYLKNVKDMFKYIKNNFLASEELPITLMLMNYPQNKIYIIMEK